MTVELPTLLLQFQPDSEELKSRQKYDQAARQFVKQLDNVSASHWSKGADTPQDVLEVDNSYICGEVGLTSADSEPRRQLNSLCFRTPPPHLRRR